MYINKIYKTLVERNYILNYSIMFYYVLNIKIKINYLFI